MCIVNNNSNDTLLCGIWTLESNIIFYLLNSVLLRFFLFGGIFVETEFGVELILMESPEMLSLLRSNSPLVHYHPFCVVIGVTQRFNARPCK